jgi:carbon-monoxide dehydrogenase medium subunit
VKPPTFAYHRSTSIDDAVAVLAEHGDEAKVLAGGQSLVPLLNLRLAKPSVLVDINHVTELGSLSAEPDLRIGAIVRHREVERSTHPLVAAAVKLIGHAAIRNRGTTAGSVAHADPAAELPALLVALDGSVAARSVRGTRTIGAAELFDGFFTTALEPDELLTEVVVPALPDGTGWAVQQFSRRSGDYGIVTVIATLRRGDDGRIAEARLAYGGVGTVPVRSTVGEAALVGAEPTEAVFDEAADAAAAALNPGGDLNGSAGYRRHLAKTLTARALREAYERSRNA